MVLIKVGEFDFCYTKSIHPPFGFCEYGRKDDN